MEAGTSPEAEAAAAEAAKREAAAALVSLSPPEGANATAPTVAVGHANAAAGCAGKKQKKASPSAVAAAAAQKKKKPLPLVRGKHGKGGARDVIRVTKNARSTPRTTPKTSNTTAKKKQKKQPPKAKRRLEPGSAELTDALNKAVESSDDDDDDEDTERDTDTERSTSTVSASVYNDEDDEDDASFIEAVTTARVGKKKTRKDPNEGVVRISARVRTTKKLIFHCLNDEEQRDHVRADPDNKFYYGKVVRGDSKNGYYVKIDELPHGHQEVFLTRKKLFAMQKDAEEPEYDHAASMVETCEKFDDSDDDTTTSKSKKKSQNPAKQSTLDFLETGSHVVATATIFEHKFGNKEGEHVVWKIHADTDYVDIPFKPPMKAEYKKEVEWLPVITENDYNKVFFDDFFPSVDGHAAKMDRFLSSTKCLMYNTVKNDKIVFHDPEADDPDWRIRVCYTLLIAAASEIEIGLENLWRSGPSGGRHNYPDFGKYIPVNYFKAFQHAAAYCWCDESLWYLPKDDKPWEVILPFIQAFNDTRKELLNVALLVLDESMSGWRPKVSTLGGIPNITYEPRKPVDLGTMIRDSAECIVGSVAHLDPVQLPEHQMQKSYFGKTTKLPNKMKIDNAIAEVLRQIKGAGVKEGMFV
jgi:hypothetical protein